jgi:hypothetical protein
VVHLAASHVGMRAEEAAKSRDRLAAKMTPAQSAEAQRMAGVWAQSHPSTY